VSHANEALERDGYAVVPDALDDEWVERLRLTFDRAPKQSGGTQHIEISDETPEVLARLGTSSGAEGGGRSFAVAALLPWRLHGRNPLPGFGQQGLHSDGLRGPGNECILITALWMLDDFTQENGATRVVPGSHRIARPLAKDFAQPLARHRNDSNGPAVPFKWSFAAGRQRTRRRHCSHIAAQSVDNESCQKRLVPRAICF